MTAPAEIKGVSKRFGRVEALRDVSLVLPAGELVALVGHNGAGKTTMMKLMLGLIRPTAGTIRLLGENPAGGDFAVRRQLGYLPENVSFNGVMTGRETLAFYARLKRAPAGSALELLDRVGLTAAAGRRVATYSKGMRQRLGLAQALLGAPRVVLLDEPTTGLDPEFRQTFYDIMLDLRAGGTTLLMSSHALTELEECADRVVIMNQGIMVANGTLAELRRKAQLPSRIVVTMADGIPAERVDSLAPGVAIRRINGHRVELICPDEDKIAVIRQVTAENAGVADLEMVPPGLDEVYAHFLRLHNGPRGEAS
ncbi:MAG: ABC transporter ATP-binding protein [Xanthobacteraceae bacterium]|nr:MAG: ABC transporter ATP-binding protein [Xanthobacteraceae bacterium]